MKNKKIIIIGGIIIALIIVAVYMIISKKDKKQITNEVEPQTTNTINNTKNQDKNDSLEVKYTSKTVRNLSSGNSQFICKEEIPEITGIDEEVANKMEKYITDWYSKVWAELNEQTKDEEITELLTSMKESNQSIGFSQSCQLIYKTDYIVTFKYILDGGLGGVSWGNTSGVSFDRATGDVIDLNEIVLSKEKYINTCRKCAYSQLKNQNMMSSLNSNYANIIEDTIDEMKGYFTEEGIVFAEIPVSSISSVSQGQFTFTVPYQDIKDYVYSNYIAE